MPSSDVGSKKGLDCRVLAFIRIDGGSPQDLVDKLRLAAKDMVRVAGRQDLEGGERGHDTVQQWYSSSCQKDLRPHGYLPGSECRWPEPAWRPPCCTEQMRDHLTGGHWEKIEIMLMRPLRRIQGTRRAAVTSSEHVKNKDITRQLGVPEAQALVDMAGA